MLGPFSLEDKAIRHISKRLGISHAKKSNIISISYQTRDPELARTIVRHLVNESRNTHASQSDGRFATVLRKSGVWHHERGSESWRPRYVALKDGSGVVIRPIRFRSSCDRSMICKLA